MLLLVQLVRLWKLQLLLLFLFIMKTVMMTMMMMINDGLASWGGGCDGNSNNNDFQSYVI